VVEKNNLEIVLEFGRYKAPHVLIASKAMGEHHSADTPAAHMDVVSRQDIHCLVLDYTAILRRSFENTSVFHCRGVFRHPRIHRPEMADGRVIECPVAYGAIRARSTAEGDMPPSKPARELFDPQDFLAKVGTGKTISKVKKDQVIYSQGEPAHSVFYIQKGRIKVLVHSDQGKEAVVGILEAGQFFGEGCLNGHALRIATTSAMEECLLTEIAKTTMIAMLHDEPKFSELFVAYLLTRNSRIEEDLIDQLFNSSERRLARLLLLLANFGKEANRTLISPNISQETLAEMIGTTRSRVSFFMNKFRKLGLISYNGKIEVHR
jgi:CRP/FNR family transcriptional regulator, cyclic AMP receptor protein